MSGTITAIQTTYKGCLFRSRLEARWAVFFDALGIAWEYEAQGYEIDMYDSKTWWLPDFWLPREKLLVEVKGEESALLKDRLVYGHAVDYGRLPAGCDGIMFLGPVPVPDRRCLLGHSVIMWDSGVIRTWVIAMFSRHLNHRLFFRFSPSDGYAVATDDLPADEGVPFLQPLQWPGEMDTVVYRAYVAARSARFEHGESG